MAAGVQNLNGKFYIPSNDQSGCVAAHKPSEATLTAPMLPFKRDPKKVSDSVEGRTHRPQDFNRKIVLAALLIQSSDYVLQHIEERDLAGEGHWLTQSLPGRTVKWTSFSREQKYSYASYALAFADAYIGFRRPETRVFYDAFAPIPNTPLVVTWGGEQPSLTIQTVSLQLACRNRSRRILDASGPATAVPVGAPPGHSADVRRAFLEGHTVQQSELAFAVKERGRRALETIEDIGFKYGLLHDERATVPCRTFGKWCADNERLGLHNLLAFREAACEFLSQSTTGSSSIVESHSSVRRAAQIVRVIDNLDSSLSRGRTVLSVGEKKLPNPSARLGLAGTTRRTKHNRALMDGFLEDARRRKLAKTYTKLRDRVLGMNTSRQRLVEYMNDPEHTTIPGGEEQNVTDMVQDFYNTLECPDVRLEKQLALDILDTMGRTAGAHHEEANMYGSDVGRVVLRRVMAEFLPDEQHEKAKHQPSCGGTRSVTVCFGMGCGLDSKGAEEYVAGWAQFYAAEKVAFEHELQRDDTTRELERIWDAHRQVQQKLTLTAELCGVVLQRRFTSLTKSEQPAYFQPSWADWPQASAAVATKSALSHARKPSAASKNELSRLDQIKLDVEPQKELDTDSDDSEAGGEQ